MFIIQETSKTLRRLDAPHSVRSDMFIAGKTRGYRAFKVSSLHTSEMFRQSEHDNPTPFGPNSLGHHVPANYKHDTPTEWGTRDWRKDFNVP
ncbi:MAG: hypothetical protein ABR568_13570 [Pyrinomonadaceae bacterium]